MLSDENLLNAISIQCECLKYLFILCTDMYQTVYCFTILFVPYVYIINSNIASGAEPLPNYWRYCDTFLAQLKLPLVLTKLLYCNNKVVTKDLILFSKILLLVTEAIAILFSSIIGTDSKKHLIQFVVSWYLVPRSIIILI